MGALELNTSGDHKERVTLFADVLLPVPITNLFTYRVPFELNDVIGIGYRVIVQFGKRKIITGIVAKIHENPPEVYQAKYIIDLLDDQPIMNKHQLNLYEWMADYYMATMGEVLNVGMPAGLKLSSESKIQINPEFDFEQSIFRSLQCDYNYWPYFCRQCCQLCPQRRRYLQPFTALIANRVSGYQH